MGDNVAPHVEESGEMTQKRGSHFPSYSEVGHVHVSPAVACLVQGKVLREVI